MSSITIVPFLRNVNRLILNPLILLAFAISFVLFIYGVVRYLSLDAADSKRKEAQNSILWGIVGMVIMFSVYGIINLILGTFGISTSELGAGAQFIK